MAYSLFDDAVNSTIWGRIAASAAAIAASARRRTTAAVSSLFGTFGK
ncbi:MAG: hypothetical protein IPO77_12995 [Acidobacteria bacterium]|nr:hypothetical protein [Acidobacteriota bacterium]